jgi:hypothetical protein
MPSNVFELVQVGEPHVCALPPAGVASMSAPSLIVRQDGFFRRDKLWRGAGVALPVFSLRTKVGCLVSELRFWSANRLCCRGGFLAYLNLN